ncbi:MAG TPA: hypothetical protein DHN33_10550 [Eubacteriaceae bacterium]|nr:hypothetical protein [Eubacteriaceae bacterium]
MLDIKGKANKKWIVISSAIFLFLLLLFVNSVLEIGERLQGIHVAVSTVFYALMILFLLWVLSLPVRWMFKAPVKDFSPLQQDKIDEKDLKEIKEILLKEESELIRISRLTQTEQIEELRKIVSKKETAIDERIVRSSLLAFLATSVSPNGLVDSIAVVYYNISMVNGIVRELGIRPNIFHIIRIFRTVFLTAFVVNQFEELDVNEYVEELMESFGEMATGKLLSKTLDSLIQGILAAFVTLKIGYSAKMVLIDPGQSNKRGFRRLIRKKSRKALVGQVLPRSLSAVPSSFRKVLERMLKRMRQKNDEGEDIVYERY